MEDRIRKVLEELVQEVFREIEGYGPDETVWWSRNAGRLVDEAMEKLDPAEHGPYYLIERSID